MKQLDIHTRLKIARKQLGYNQQSIAEDLNIKQKTVSEIENGKIMNIPNEYIYYFYKKGIALEWIYTGKGSMFIKQEKEKPDISAVSETFNFKNNENKPENDKFFEKEHSFGKNYEYDLPEKGTFLSDLLKSKDENILALANYIKAQERMILFLQEIIRKELKL